MQEPVRNVAVLPFVVGPRLVEQLVDAPVGERLMPLLAAAAIDAAVSRGGRSGRGHTGRTSCTSGMKWRSRFSMPWRSVAVELGQPEQAPRMCRNTIPSR